MADVSTSIIGEARGFLSGFETEEVLGSYTRVRVERIIRAVVGLGCVVFGAQAIAAATTADAFRSLPQVILMIITFTTLGGVVIGCLANRSAAAFATVFAVAYVVVLFAWPVVVDGANAVDAPWIYFLMNVATAAAVLAFPLPLQLLWTLGVPVIYGVVRALEQGLGQRALISTGLDTFYGLFLGGAIFALVFFFRRVAARVDETRALAVRSFARAAAVDAAERERVAVSALMHDSVLAALIAAERAHSSRENHLAVSMAREALTRLANAERDSLEGSDSPVTLREMSADLAALVGEAGVRTAVAPFDGEDDGRRVPGRVARAVVLAAAQAVTNSVQHARGSGLAVRLEPRGEAGVVVEVSDRGKGFDVDAVPDDRLGIRGSIVARLSAVGGTADLQSGPDGTRVTLAWEPAP